MAPTQSTFTPEKTRTNALFHDTETDDGKSFDDARLDTFESPMAEDGTAASKMDEFEFEALKDSRIDWRVVARADARSLRRERDIDGLEQVLETVVRADIDSITNQDMAEPKRGREVTKLLQMLVEYLLHVQEALSEGKGKAEREAAGWKERARRERDECRKYARELRLQGEAHEAELVAVAAEYAKKRNSPDNAELEDARRRGEAIASERAAKDMEKRLREQRELFDSAVDRMRAAHAEAQAEAARELAARKAELAAARAEYVANSADAAKEASKMVQDAQGLIREAREKAELEKSNVARLRADLNAAAETSARHQRALAENRLELAKLGDDLKFEREANAELRKALERRDDERKVMRDQIERLNAKKSQADGEESAELNNMRNLVRDHFTQIERLKRENEVLRSEKDASSDWMREEKAKWVSANEQILEDELAAKEDEITAKSREIAQLKSELERERSRQMITIRPVIEEVTRATAPPVAKRAPPPSPPPRKEATQPKSTQPKKELGRPPPRSAKDIEGAMSAIMHDIDVDGDSGTGISDDAFEAAMARFEATRLKDVPKNLRKNYLASRAEIQKEMDSVVVGGVH